VLHDQTAVLSVVTTGCEWRQNLEWAIADFRAMTRSTNIAMALNEQLFAPSPTHTTAAFIALPPQTMNQRPSCFCSLVLGHSLLHPKSPP
jgi:hypothetical protein